MDIHITPITDPTTAATPCLVLPVSGTGPGDAEQALDQACGGLLATLRQRGDLPAKTGDLLLLPTVSGLAADRLLLVGTGTEPLGETGFDKLVSALFGRLREMNIDAATLLTGELDVTGREQPWILTRLARAALLVSYHYTDTLSKPRPAPTLSRVELAAEDSDVHRRAAARGAAIGRGMNLARHLGDLPANYLTPTGLAERAQALAADHERLEVEILDEEALRELGMGALLAVTAGTEEPARFIVLRYQGAGEDQAPQVLVGKGVTFDSGGISLKPGAKMDEMKYDMCGAASVLGTLQAVAELELELNVVGLIAAAENMPSGRASRPSDVVTSMAGKTIEILNTDAEGRLLLCDALTYAGRFQPAAVIDIATLTGACVVALGHHATAVYSNQEALGQALLAAGETAGDRGWPMPLWDDYQKQLDSNFADLANVGGPEGGSVTAACFLARFAEDYHWAHLDIAGTAWRPGTKKGATGRPVAMLSQYLIDLVD